MTKTFFSILFVVFTTSVSYSESIKTIKPKPNKATVYLSGAEISYSESVSLAQGTNQLIIEGVSPYLDEQSISAFFKGAMVIDTRKSFRYTEQPKKDLSPFKYDALINKITDSLEDISFIIKDFNNKFNGFQKEKSLLLNNRLMKGEFRKDSLELLKSTLDLLRIRLTDIDEESLKIERKLSQINKQKSKLDERLNYFNNLKSNNGIIDDEQFNQPIHQIIVTVEAVVPIIGQLSLKYFVAQAAWMPIYDVQANSGVNKIQLIYRAQVYQNTGLDWKDIALVLSTSNPTLGNTKPILNEWNLFFGYANGYLDNLKKTKSLAPMQYNNLGLNRESLNNNISITDDESEKAPEIPEQLFTVDGNLLRTEYQIKTKYSIVSDNKPHQVVINNIEIPVALAYLAVPKLDLDAFLMGKISDWEDLNLIPGQARIYFDESFIGTTTINPASSKDTLYVNLGRDKSIVIKRQNIKEKCKEQVLGDQKVVLKTIEITVRNTKNISLDFEIEDQIPITNDNNIKIKMLENDKARYNEATGKLTWAFKLKSKETKKFKFSFEVTYPKDKFIQGL